MVKNLMFQFFKFHMDIRLCYLIYLNVLENMVFIMNHYLLLLLAKRGYIPIVLT